MKQKSLLGLAIGIVMLAACVPLEQTLRAPAPTPTHIPSPAAAPTDTVPTFTPDAGVTPAATLPPAPTIGVTATATVAPTEEAPMTGTAVPPVYDSAMEPLVQRAIADLAARFNVPPEEISVLEARLVVWPDPSMGCPQPGMQYLQVPQDGAFIQLSAGGRPYNYHSGGNQGLFLCQQKPRKLVPNLTPIIPPPRDNAGI
jgi:hypothetical protein